MTLVDVLHEAPHGSRTRIRMTPQHVGIDVVGDGHGGGKSRRETEE